MRMKGCARGYVMRTIVLWLGPGMKLRFCSMICMSTSHLKSSVFAWEDELGITFFRNRVKREFESSRTYVVAVRLPRAAPRAMCCSSSLRWPTSTTL